jgi:hypothetical protein
MIKFMKKIIKMIGIVAFLVILMNFETKEIQAARVQAQITVDYVVLEGNGDTETISYENYKGITNTLVLPDGSEVTMETDTAKKYSAIGYFLAEGNDVSKLQTGTYTLKDIQYPEGYELDTEALEEEIIQESYPLSITITDEEVESYLSYLDWLTERYGSGRDKEDVYDFLIYVPVKKIGEPSLLMQAPPKAELTLLSDTLLSVTQGGYNTQFYYAAKKNGTYHLLDDLTDCLFSDHDELKDGKTYYFRARFVRIIKGETVYGEYSDILKVKVRKSSVYRYTPKLKTEKKKGKTVLKVLGKGTGNYDIMLYYSTKKNGKYHFSKDSFSETVILSDSQELKRGKTYYFKAKFCDRSHGSQVYCSEFSKTIAVRIK